MDILWTLILSAPDTFIALCAMLIALLALFATIWQGYLARQHNRLSVRPLLEFERHRIPHSDRVGIYLHNHGTGTAILKQLKIWQGGVELTMKNDSWFTQLPSKAKIKFCFLSFDSDVYIPGNDETMLIEVKTSDYSPHQIDEFIVFLDDLSFEVEFSCVYGAKYKEKLAPFGRI